MSHQMAASNLIAAVITFQHKSCSKGGQSPDRFIESYCQKEKNGGGDVSTIVYPWKRDQDKALVIFDADPQCCPPDVVQTLANKKQHPITDVVEFSEPQCFGLVETSVSPLLLEKLLSQFTLDKIISRLEQETGIKVTCEDSQNRLLLEGFYFQIKLVEESLHRLDGEIDSSKKPSPLGAFSQSLVVEPSVALVQQHTVCETSELPTTVLNTSRSVQPPTATVDILAAHTTNVLTALEFGASQPVLAEPNSLGADLHNHSSSLSALEPTSPTVPDDQDNPSLADPRVTEASAVSYEVSTSVSFNCQPSTKPNIPSIKEPTASTFEDDRSSNDYVGGQDTSTSHTISTPANPNFSAPAVDSISSFPACSTSHGTTDDIDISPIEEKYSSFTSSVTTGSGGQSTTESRSSPTDKSASEKDPKKSQEEADNLTKSKQFNAFNRSNRRVVPSLPDAFVLSSGTKEASVKLAEKEASLEPESTRERGDSDLTEEQELQEHEPAERRHLETEPVEKKGDSEPDVIEVQGRQEPEPAVRNPKAKSAKERGDSESDVTDEQERQEPEPAVRNPKAKSAKERGDSEPDVTDKRERREPEPAARNPKAKPAKERGDSEPDVTDKRERRAPEPAARNPKAKQAKERGDSEPDVTDKRERREPEPAARKCLEAESAEKEGDFDPDLSQKKELQEPEPAGKRDLGTEPAEKQGNSEPDVIQEQEPSPAKERRDSEPGLTEYQENQDCEPAEGLQPKSTKERQDSSLLEKNRVAAAIEDLPASSVTGIASAPNTPLASSRTTQSPPNSAAVKNLESTDSESSPVLSTEKEISKAAVGKRQARDGDTADVTIKGEKITTLKVEEDFDQIYYEFVKIIREGDYKREVLEKYGGQVQEVSHPTDSRLIRIQISSHKPGEAAKMMDALNDMFYEINRSVHSHSTKLLYDGDKEKLDKALVNQFRDPKQGFIARLVTAEDIRIIGSLANMDRDLSIVESFISDYKKKYPAPAVTMVTQPDIALPNGTVVTVMQGDLTKMKTDAVVSSSGPDLSHKRGVSKAIANACGQKFVAQGRKFISTGGVLVDGDSFVQRADGRMAINGVHYIIHAIAPLPQKGKDIRTSLVRTIRNALKEAETRKCRTVALPAICSGNMGVPIQTCAECYWTALAEYSSQNPLHEIKQVLFVVDDLGMVIQIHEVMRSISSGAAGATAAYTGGFGSRQQVTPSQRGSSSGGRGGRTNPTYDAEVELNDLRLSEGREPRPHHGGKKGTKNAGASTSQTPSSVDLENREASRGLIGMAQDLVSGVSYLVTGGMYADENVEQQMRPTQLSSYPSAASSSAPTKSPVTSSTGSAATGNAATGSIESAAKGSTERAVKGSTGSAATRNAAKGSTGSAANIHGTSAAAGSSTPRDSECPICMDDIKDPIALPCSHKFCRACLDQMETTTKSHLCPTCRTPFRTAEGKQPKGGIMTTTTQTYTHLPGYPTYGTIVITYTIPSGVQGPEHPNPGERFTGTSRTAYLPNNTQGRKAERLLRKAFNQRMVFTIGQSVTTGRDNCIVWNDIHHKTNMSGGPSNYGYPDPDYLNRLIEDLQAKGITE